MYKISQYRKNILIEIFVAKEFKKSKHLKYKTDNLREILCLKCVKNISQGQPPKIF